MATQEELIAIEEYRAKLTDWVNAREHSRSWSLEAYRTTAELASTAIKSTFLVNGGALVALLAFIGDAAGSGNADEASKFGSPIASFAFGLIFSVVAAAAAYASVYWKAIDPAPNPPNAQSAGSDAPSGILTRGAKYHRLTVTCIVVSIACFVSGAIAGFTSLTQ